MHADSAQGDQDKLTSARKMVKRVMEDASLSNDSPSNSSRRLLGPPPLPHKSGILEPNKKE